MKKFAILAMALCLFSQAKAEDVLGFAPVAAAPGANSVTTRFDVQLLKDSENEVSQLQFDVNVPTGMSLVSAATTKGLLPTYQQEEEDEETGDIKMVTKYYHSMTCVKVEDNHWRVTVTTSTAGVKFAAGNGIVARIRYRLDAGMAAGVYPVKIYGVRYSGTDGISHTYPATTSYVKVGVPTNATLALEGEVPSLVNTALAKEPAITGLDLAEVTAVNGDFTYVAGRNVVRPTADVTANVKFDAPLAGTYSSFCAPVDVTTPCYTFTSCDGTTAVFTPAGVAPAGEPVLINEAVNSTAASATLESVAAQNITSGYYVANDGSGMRSVKTSATIPALRGSWNIPAASNLRIAIETPTGIQVIGTADEVFGNTYDLKGRQTTNAKNGVFVVNGKKQFVK